MCRVSLSACGTILVTGLLPRKTVSKHEFGGRKVLMMAVVDMSGDSELELGVELELLLLPVPALTLLVARGGRQEKVALILAVLSWLLISRNSSESASLMV